MFNYQPYKPSRYSMSYSSETITPIVHSSMSAALVVQLELVSWLLSLLGCLDLVWQHISRRLAVHQHSALP
jgi:hypothetical protein